MTYKNSNMRFLSASPLVDILFSEHDISRIDRIYLMVTIDPGVSGPIRSLITFSEVAVLPSICLCTHPSEESSFTYEARLRVLISPIKTFRAPRSAFYDCQHAMRLSAAVSYC